MMRFCPKCGILLKSGKDKMTCPECSYEEEEKESIKTSEKTPEKKETAIVKEENETMPITKATCPKCEHNEAYFWSVQTRAADEAPTSFFRCTKCKHTWREYR